MARSSGVRCDRSGMSAIIVWRYRRVPVQSLAALRPSPQMRVPTERRDLPFEILERGDDHLGHNVNDVMSTTVCWIEQHTLSLLYRDRNHYS